MLHPEGRGQRVEEGWNLSYVFLSFFFYFFLKKTIKTKSNLEEERILFHLKTLRSRSVPERSRGRSHGVLLGALVPLDWSVYSLKHLMTTCQGKITL